MGQLRLRWSWALGFLSHLGTPGARREASGAAQAHWGLCGRVGGAGRPRLAVVMFVTSSSVIAITVVVVLKDGLRDPS